MRKLRFGVIGMSEGNGHPYSWSAIFNGYDPAAMAACPYPAIPDYLGRRSFPADAIETAAVTHVWTQDRRMSALVAAASRIAHIVDDPRDMLGHVDGVLLARDDAEHHREMAAPFLTAGLPVYIDKPLAFSVAEAERIYALAQRPGQVFTCTPLAFADELRLDPAAIERLGRLRRVVATTVKDWDHYAVHVLEPLVNLLAVHGAPRIVRCSGGLRRELDLAWASGLVGTVVATGTEDGDIRIHLDGEAGSRELIFEDTFSAFRAALRHFTGIVRGDSAPLVSTTGLAGIRLSDAGHR